MRQVQEQSTSYRVGIGVAQSMVRSLRFPATRGWANIIDCFGSLYCISVVDLSWSFGRRAFVDALGLPPPPPPPPERFRILDFIEISLKAWRRYVDFFRECFLVFAAYFSLSVGFGGAKFGTASVGNSEVSFVTDSFEVPTEERT